MALIFRNIHLAALDALGSKLIFVAFSTVNVVFLWNERSEKKFKIFKIYIYRVPYTIFAFMKASFWGLFRTNFCGHFRKLFLFTKFNFSKFREKVSLTVLRSMCLEFYASNYFT